jgi:8-oxo-dGTP diphosphatase
MEIIQVIRDADISENFPLPAEYRERVSARAIVFDTEGNMALLHVTKKNYHKLPGGGVEKGEEIKQGLIRELKEEIGCAVENIRELGIIEEYRNKHALRQISHCFIADLSGEKGMPDLDEGEIADGFEPVWVRLEEAVRTLESEALRVEEYGEKFMCLRDLTILKEAQRILQSEAPQSR